MRVRASTTAAALVLTFVGGALVSCPAPPGGNRGPVSLSLQVATRQSCGVLSGLDYDTSCIGAIDVRAVDPDTGLPIEGTEDCKVVAATPQLRDLLEGAPIAFVHGLSTNRSVIFQVRGLHNVGAGGVDGGPALDLCAQPEISAHWLFWGESAPVNLAAYDSAKPPDPVIRIVIDCRDCTFTDGCDSGTCFGCGGVGSDTCRADFPTSFCIPDVACDKACESDDDCFQGALGCVNHVCDNSGAPTGTLCSRCGGGTGCGPGFQCVQRAGADPFCADECPNDVCATGTKCNRLHNNLELVAP